MKVFELINTLTGFEEIAIEQCTGYPLEDLSDPGTKDNPKPNRQGTLVRAMGAVVIARRDDVPVKTAWGQILKMSRDQVGELFPDEDTDDEIEPIEGDDEPVTEAGKDDSGSGNEPTSSPQSSSTPVSVSTPTSS